MGCLFRCANGLIKLFNWLKLYPIPIIRGSRSCRLTHRELFGKNFVLASVMTNTSFIVARVVPTNSLRRVGDFIHLLKIDFGQYHAGAAWPLKR